MSSEQGEDLGAVWVLSDAAPDGTYVCAIHFTDDRAVILDRDGALRYAAAVCDAAARAEYDAATFAQLSASKGLTMQDVAQMVVEMRGHRPPVDEKATAPLRFASNRSSA